MFFLDLFLCTVLIVFDFSVHLCDATIRTVMDSGSYLSSFRKVLATAVKVGSTPVSLSHIQAFLFHMSVYYKPRGSVCSTLRVLVTGRSALVLDIFHKFGVNLSTWIFTHPSRLAGFIWFFFEMGPSIHIFSKHPEFGRFTDFFFQHFDSSLLISYFFAKFGFNRFILNVCLKFEHTWF